MKYFQNTLGIICGIDSILLLFFKEYMGIYYDLFTKIGDTCVIIFILVFAFNKLKR